MFNSQSEHRLIVAHWSFLVRLLASLWPLRGKTSTIQSKSSFSEWQNCSTTNTGKSLSYNSVSLCERIMLPLTTELRSDHSIYIIIHPLINHYTLIKSDHGAQGQPLSPCFPLPISRGTGLVLRGGGAPSCWEAWLQHSCRGWLWWLEWERCEVTEGDSTHTYTPVIPYLSLL